MKKIAIYSFLFAPLFLGSCSLFELDNYDEPKETIRGVVVDKATGEPVLTDQGSEGIRVRMKELSWGDNADYNPDFYCMPDGSFQNTKIFEGYYHVTVDGPFIPLIREVEDTGVPIADESMELNIKGVTEVKFEVEPFLHVEWAAEPTVSNGRITAKVKVTRGVDKQTFRDKIEPMNPGAYTDDYLNVTDIQLFVSYSSTVGYRARDERWSSQIEYTGSAFEPLLGEPVTIKSLGTIPSGRKVFIRAAARIDYPTAEIKRWNYSDVMEIIIP
ncbi:MAG: DUF3823 domain-containing protein [Alistipes sp.]|nr:DUF3823 domain-containing protein [Alistipes sp.]